MADRDELGALRAENSRLIALLESHGIEWRTRQQPSPPPVESARRSTDEEVALFRRLFRGRTDAIACSFHCRTPSSTTTWPAITRLRDKRVGGQPLDVSFVGGLRPDQEAAVAAMLPFDAGVLCAPTAFGKTVTAAAMIARRGVNTLVLVHRTELLKQWQERLQAFLDVG